MTTSIPNTQSLKRVNYETIFLNGNPANLPITCPTPTINKIPSVLPTNPNFTNIPTSSIITNNMDELEFTNRCPIYVNPSGSNAGSSPVAPVTAVPIKPDEPPPPEDIIEDLPYIKDEPEPETPVVIPDGGQLVCSITENICTGKIISTRENNYSNPTSASDVPGPIMELHYNNNKYPTYYPRQRYSYLGGNDEIN